VTRVSKIWSHVLCYALCSDELEELEEQVREEAGKIMRLALLQKSERDPKYKLPRMANVSVVLCNDMHIRALNFQHRNQDKPTDVLSFEMDDDLDYKVGSKKCRFVFYKEATVPRRLLYTWTVLYHQPCFVPCFVHSKHQGL